MGLTINEHPPAGLPPVADLVAVIRANPVPAALDKSCPGIDLDAVTGTAGAADWLGVTKKTIYSERSRKKADGTPRWPKPDETIGRSPFWAWRTLAIHAAGMAQGFRNSATQVAAPPPPDTTAHDASAQ